MSTAADARAARAEPAPAGQAQDALSIEPCRKRVRVMFNGATIADSLSTILLLEQGHMPVYYFPRTDVRADLLARTQHLTHCPLKGDASYWSIETAGRTSDNAAWSYEHPLPHLAGIAGALAFYWDRVDHWFEEDEEVFGHARDPHHRVDVRASTREVRVDFAGERVATTRRGLFLFETGLPTRYYIPPEDVLARFLEPSQRRSTCPYKGNASYWSLRVGDREARDAVWSYLDPLPDCPRIKGHLCFYPEKVDRLEVEGEVMVPLRPLPSVNA
jgi:uncharacterized protein (DUF427 family)